MFVRLFVDCFHFFGEAEMLTKLLRSGITQFIFLMGFAFFILLNQQDDLPKMLPIVLADQLTKTQAYHLA